jgi:hypothetical protein
MDGAAFFSQQTGKPTPHAVGTTYYPHFNIFHLLIAFCLSK